MLSEFFIHSGIVITEETQMDYGNNEEPGHSGIAVKEEMETNEAAGIKNVDFVLIMANVVYYFFFQIFFLLFSENFIPSGIVVKEEIEMNFANNEEAGPSEIVVKEDIDEAAGIKIIISYEAYLSYN